MDPSGETAVANAQVPWNVTPEVGLYCHIALGLAAIAFAAIGMVVIKPPPKARRTSLHLLLVTLFVLVISAILYALASGITPDDTEQLLVATLALSLLSSGAALLALSLTWLLKEYRLATSVIVTCDSVLQAVFLSTLLGMARMVNSVMGSGDRNPSWIDWAFLCLSLVVALTLTGCGFLLRRSRGKVVKCLRARGPKLLALVTLLFTLAFYVFGMFISDLVDVDRGCFGLVAVLFLGAFFFLCQLTAPSGSLRTYCISPRRRGVTRRKLPPKAEPPDLRPEPDSP